ncbi:hypothetical protein I4U23_015148 [Adineta vaga]|nr:hypothetical protein I4U23_015148 [Adineta vaga]
MSNENDQQNTSEDIIIDKTSELCLGDDDQRDHCSCTTDCLQRSCPCFKYGHRCSSLCQCGNSCQNIFNHLEFFFGENVKSAAHPCSTKWLARKTKNLDELTKIDRYALVRHI